MSQGLPDGWRYGAVSPLPDDTDLWFWTITREGRWPREGLVTLAGVSNAKDYQDDAARAAWMGR